MFHVPIRPYSPIDALNRRAAALGSPRYGELAAHADYNGHHVILSWNEYRGYYIAEYFWAGRVVLARGSFADCLRAAMQEQDRGVMGSLDARSGLGALGASVDVIPRDNDAEAIALCEADPRMRPNRAEFQPSEWYTWCHQAAAESARDYANPGALVRVFDWEIMQAAESLEAYESAVRAKHGRVYC